MVLLFFICLLSAYPLIATVFDFYIHLKRYFLRFKIGHWDNIESWKKKVKSRCVKWLKKTPTIPRNDNERLILNDIIHKRYYSESIQYWQFAGLIFGLGEGQVVSTFIASVIDLNSGLLKRKINSIEVGILAFAILRIENPILIRPAMDQVYDFILDVKGNNNTIPYRKGWDNIRFVDTLAFVCPFLMLYAEKYDIDYARQLAEDCYDEYDGLLLPQFHLPPHAYREDISAPLGLYDWGRGLGWFILAILGMYDYSSPTFRRRLDSRLFDITRTLLLCQSRNGGFSSQLLVEGRQVEGSSTVLCGLLLYKAYLLSHDNKIKISLDRLINQLMHITRKNGSLDYCQGDTKKIGDYSYRYDIMPFAQGMLLLLINRYVGIEDKEFS